ncbi:aminopeptidase P family protein [bacterium]|jgi:Xaa-Pro dipeptidase|nr:aminopeptidase P family protein [bacterium]MBT4649444.1 aminopeptidase P family protein [bacterium]
MIKIKGTLEEVLFVNCLFISVVLKYTQVNLTLRNIMWSKQQIEYHEKAAKLLIKIKDLTFKHIQNNRSISEYEIQQFVLEKFQEHNLETDKYPPIVSYNQNSATPEFYPKKSSEKLKDNTFILIDLWAKLKIKNAPFADITWLSFYGKKVPTEIQQVFDVVVTARDGALKYIEIQLENNKIPTGKDIENVAFEIIKKAGFEKNILHELGHSLGIEQDHGPKPNWIYQKNKKSLLKNLGYTIEPGIYIENKFGIRSEIDFYISSDDKLIVTTDLQKEIILL